MGFFGRLFGKKDEEKRDEPAMTAPADAREEVGGEAEESILGVVVEELSRWSVSSDGEPCAEVSYGRDAKGRLCVQIDSTNKNAADFILYYLDDPLDGHPVYIHGLGFQKGPHTRDQEQFDIAMSVMGHHFPAFQTEPL